MCFGSMLYVIIICFSMKYLITETGVLTFHLLCTQQPFRSSRKTEEPNTKKDPLVDVMMVLGCLKG